MDPKTGIIEQAQELRKPIKELAEKVKALRTTINTSPVSGPSCLYSEEADTSEMIANVMLAYRHLEDAAMRLGKVVQAADGGKSVYPK